MKKNFHVRFNSGGNFFYTYRNHRSLLIRMKMYKDRRLSGAGKLNKEAEASK
jgi:hypothetical protein